MRRNCSSHCARLNWCACVASERDRRALGDAVALPKRHVVASRQFDQFLQGVIAVARRSDARSVWAEPWCRSHPSEITVRQRSGLVHHRQAPLHQRHQLLFASRWRRCVRDERVERNGYWGVPKVCALFQVGLFRRTAQGRNAGGREASPSRATLFRIGGEMENSGLCPAHLAHLAK